MYKCKTNYFISNLLSLWQHIHVRRKRQIWILLTLMVLVSILEIIGIGATLPFLSVITEPERLFNYHMAQPFILKFNIENSQQLLLPVTIAFSLIAITTGGARLLLLWAMTRLASTIGADLSISAYRRTLYQPYIVHVARNSSIVISGVNGKTAEVVGLVILPILVIINASLMFVMVLSTLVAIEAVTAFYAFAGFALLYSIVIFVTKEQLQKNGNLISRESNQIQKALQEGLGGIRDVLIDGTQEVYCKIYQNSIRPMRRANANIQIIGGSPRFIIEAFGMVLIASLAYFLAKRPEGIFTALPLMGVLVLSAQRLLPLLQQGYASWTQIQSSKATLIDTLDLLNQPLPECLDSSTSAEVVFKSKITLRRISFQYHEGSKWILKNLDLSIYKGARIGIVGKTGSGKSTLLDLVMGLLAPTNGHLLIDDQEVTSQNCRAWQSHIAHVPQAIFLADITIAENIALGIPYSLIDHARVKAAAAKAQIANIIESLPQGYDTFVGERGVRLSGGQRQRIGIARALYKNADVIVFDEATSALDTQTEHAVMEVIDQLSTELTIIIVAHRLTTLRGCNQIIELDSGEIKYIGNYLDLAKR